MCRQEEDDYYLLISRHYDNMIKAHNEEFRKCKFHDIHFQLEITLQVFPNWFAKTQKEIWVGRITVWKFVGKCTPTRPRVKVKNIEHGKQQSSYLKWSESKACWKKNVAVCKERYIKFTDSRLAYMFSSYRRVKTYWAWKRFSFNLASAST